MNQLILKKFEPTLPKRALVGEEISAEGNCPVSNNPKRSLTDMWEGTVGKYYMPS